MDARAPLLFALLAGMSATASASSPSPSRGRDISRILELQEEIAEGVRHAEDALSDAQRHAIRAEQRRIRWLVADKPSLDALTRDQRLQLVNAQERINAVMHGTRVAEERRLICRRERPTGTNVAFDRCITVIRYELERENAERFLRGDAMQR